MLEVPIQSLEFLRLLLASSRIRISSLPPLIFQSAAGSSIKDVGCANPVPGVSADAVSEDADESEEEYQNDECKKFFSVMDHHIERSYGFSRNIITMGVTWAELSNAD